MYVHIPFCEAKCAYCGFYSVPIGGWDASAVIRTIVKELDMLGLGRDFAKTIYIGGGSPSCIGEENLLWLVRELAGRNTASEEFTVEVNPAQTNLHTLTALKNAGVDRLSIGVQSFDKELLRFLGRRYEPEAIGQTLLNARNAGFTNISMDLIFAIPGQTEAVWNDTLKAAIDLGPEHISAYSLSYEENTPFERLRSEGRLTPTSEDTDRQMYYMAIDKLAYAGFEQYEISNFAKPGFQCRHNLLYWLNEPFVGIGPAAASFCEGVRRQNAADVKKYCDEIDAGKLATEESHAIDNIEFACQSAVLGLRKMDGVSFGRFKAVTGFDFKRLFAYAIKSNVEKGFLIIENDRIRLSRDALAIADSVLCDFADV